MQQVIALGTTTTRAPAKPQIAGGTSLFDKLKAGEAHRAKYLLPNAVLAPLSEATRDQFRAIEPLDLRPAIDITAALPKKFPAAWYNTPELAAQRRRETSQLDVGLEQHRPTGPTGDLPRGAFVPTQSRFLPGLEKLIPPLVVPKAPVGQVLYYNEKNFRYVEIDFALDGHLIVNSPSSVTF